MTGVQTCALPISPATNFGAATTLRIDGDDPAGTGKDLAALVQFDTASIPAGATVIDASIRFRAVDPSVSAYRAYPVLRSWTEAGATWRNATTTSLWAIPGAIGATDRGSTPVGTIAAPSLGTVTLALDGTGVALVQGWVNGTTPNRGLIIAPADQTDGVDLASSEATTGTSRPTLVITYR